MVNKQACHYRSSGWILAVALCCGWAASPAVAAQESAEKAIAASVLEATGVTGGFVVHVGCGDGKLTAALRAGDAYLVQGLETGAEQVGQARQYLRSAGDYGNVTAARFDGARLPYVDELVNLLVVSRRYDIDRDEMLRVLCPGGVAVTLGPQGSIVESVRKPWPQEIDQWTHYLHDASGNAVSRDMRVGPPRHFRWTGSPRWSRHHDRRASVSAMVSAEGRMFYVFDEGSTASIMLPPKTVLIARDAFNGTILWKRRIPTWHTHLWPFKSGPTQLQRRLVAVGDRVYVTLGLDAPLMALDAATGRTVQTYEGSFATEEVIASEGVLLLLVNDQPQRYDDFRPEDVGIGAERDRVMRDWPWDERPRQIVAVQADTGEVLWKRESRVVPLTLAADADRVYFHDGQRLVAVDRKTGDPLWRSEPVERQEKIPTNIMPTLVVYKDVVLFYGVTRKLTGVSAKTGQVLWTGPHPRSGHYCPEDVLVAGGLVWGGEIASGRDSGVFLGRDPHTGEVKSEFPPDIDIFFMHQRCYRSKATERYLLPSWTGIEYIDFRNKHWVTNHWVRSGCIYGIMPCNGLTYTTPHDCACYMQAKLYGFCALAAEEPGVKSRESRAGKRLERGLAYDQALDPGHSTLDSAAWPTYRHDAARSGSTTAVVPSKLTPGWQSELGGRLSSLVAAGGKLFVASIDAHTLHALDADSGTRLWSYTAGGRIDSPPTIWNGRALFGCADGCVYCLRASDGALVWRFRAGPEDRRMTAFEQVESVWPVSGSVLVRDGVVYCVAGRSMFLDGGLRYLRIDAASGKLISEVIFDDRDPQSGENLQRYVEVRNMPVALPDILSSDGKFLYMRSQPFDVNGNRTSLVQIKGSDANRGADQQGPTTHLFSPTGFLDDTWWHRSYWVYGQRFSEGAGGWPQAGKFAPAGRILVVDEENVYGFGRKPTYYRWRTPLEYHLFATGKRPQIVRDPAPAKPKAKGAGPPRAQHPQYQWSRTVPLLVRAMVLAGKTLFIAGPPDVVDEEEAFRRVGDPAMDAKLVDQDAALAGQQGALLWAVSATDGRKLAEYRLDSLPVFDSLIAAQGRLYVSTIDGQVRCIGSR